MMQYNAPDRQLSFLKGPQHHSHIAMHYFQLVQMVTTWTKNYKFKTQNYKLQPRTVSGYVFISPE